MLTRTSGLKLAKEHQIFMVSVDTGWITDELPIKRRIKTNVNMAKSQSIIDSELKSKDFIFNAPLDEIDGAARCLHPIWNGMRGKTYFVVFLKDYRIISW